MPRTVAFEHSPLRDEAHRRVFAAVLLAPASAAAIATTAGVEGRRTARVLLELADSGLVQRLAGQWHPVTSRLAFDLIDAVSRPGTPIPRRPGPRLDFLRRVVEVFEPGILYPEAEVNDRLRPVNPDVATLRRHLVDAGLLQRGGGVYGRPSATPGPGGPAGPGGPGG